jgi:hypothetical protein
MSKTLRLPSKTLDNSGPKKAVSLHPSPARASDWDLCRQLAIVELLKSKDSPAGAFSQTEEKADGALPHSQQKNSVPSAAREQSNFPRTLNAGKNNFPDVELAEKPR